MRDHGVEGVREPLYLCTASSPYDTQAPRAAADAAAASADAGAASADPGAASTAAGGISRCASDDVRDLLEDIIPLEDGRLLKLAQGHARRVKPAGRLVGLVGCGDAVMGRGKNNPKLAPGRCGPSLPRTPHTADSPDLAQARFHHGYISDECDEFLYSFIQGR